MSIGTMSDSRAARTHPRPYAGTAPQPLRIGATGERRRSALEPVRRGDGGLVGAAGRMAGPIAGRERFPGGAAWTPGRDARLGTMSDVDLARSLRWGLLDSSKVLDTPLRHGSNRVEIAKRRRDMPPARRNHPTGAEWATHLFGGGVLDISLLNG
jgi:hypothetical protein